MGISGINGVGRVTAFRADTPASTGNTRPAHTASAVELDEVTLQPKPLRFPWLSRVSRELEAAARQRPAFPAAPVLGDRLDQSA